MWSGKDTRGKCSHNLLTLIDEVIGLLFSPKTSITKAILLCKHEQNVMRCSTDCDAGIAAVSLEEVSEL